MDAKRYEIKIVVQQYEGEDSGHKAQRTKLEVLKALIKSQSNSNLNTSANESSKDQPVTQFNPSRKTSMSGYMDTVRFMPLGGPSSSLGAPSKIPLDSCDMSVNGSTASQHRYDHFQSIQNHLMQNAQTSKFTPKEDEIFQIKHMQSDIKGSDNGSQQSELEIKIEDGPKSIEDVISENQTDWFSFKDKREF